MKKPTVNLLIRSPLTLLCSNSSVFFFLTWGLGALCRLGAKILTSLHVQHNTLFYWQTCCLVLQRCKSTLMHYEKLFPSCITWIIFIQSCTSNQLAYNVFHDSNCPELSPFQQADCENGLWTRVIKYYHIFSQLETPEQSEKKGSGERDRTVTERSEVIGSTTLKSRFQHLWNQAADLLET